MAFEINMLNSSYEKNTNFGVYRGEVSVPDRYVCTKNAKMFTRFFYVVKGTIVFDKGTNHMVIAPKGSIVYLPYDITYISEWENDENGEYISINFMLQDFYVQLPNHICIAAIDKTGSYLELFINAYEAWEKGAIGYRLALLSDVYKLLYFLFRDSTYKNYKKQHSSIYKGIFYLENHYTEDFSVEFLADMCNISAGSFRRHFKSYRKMSPITYRNYLRIQKAKELIQSGEYNITEAANSVNIPDLCYFNKLFRKYYQISPSDFLRENKHI